MKIELISPAFKVPVEDFTKTLKFWGDRSVEFLYSLHLLQEDCGDLLCSASKEQRLEEIKRAFSPLSEANFVWALRGGYGSQELLPFLSPELFDQDKVFMGFSDCTLIHYYLNMQLNRASLHGPHPNSFVKFNYSEEFVINTNDLIENPKTYKELEFSLKFLSTNGGDSLKELEAPVVGGNLTNLICLLGTPFNKGAASRILFLEEVEEPAYKVNRMLEQLYQSGFLKEIRALIFGHMTHSKPSEALQVEKVLKRFAERLSCPVLWKMSAGHDHVNNRPFWLNKKSLLKLDENPCLINNI